MADTLKTDLFAAYADLIGSAPSGRMLRDDMEKELTIAAEGTIRMVYAPFDYVERNAVLVLLGITPGRVQAEHALAVAREGLRRGGDLPDVLRQAKLAASFSGPMRANLVAMLDHVGLNRALSTNSCVSLFEVGARKVHFTSALRYPVFVDGQNYSGAPDMLTTPILRAAVDRWLGEELRLLPNALWLPLGPRPAAALELAANEGRIDRRNILSGLPHPSGANAERISYFLNRKERAALSTKTNPDNLDGARHSLRQRVAQFAERQV